jgi:hypothetical protein
MRHAVVVRRERIAAAIAVGLLGLWKAAAFAWMLANPVEIGPIRMDGEEWRGREALRALGREGEGDGEGRRLGVPDEADQAAAMDARTAVPVGDDDDSRDLVIGADPAPPTLDDLRAALRARGSAPESISGGPHAVEPGEIELRPISEDLELSDSSPPDIPLLLWVHWLVWGLLLALASVALAALGRTTRSTATLGSAACFGALAIGTAITMSGWQVGLHWPWLDVLPFAVLGVGAALGTWAASAPRLGPIALVGAAIGVQLSGLVVQGGEVIAIVVGVCTPLFVLAFALWPQRPTQPALPVDGAS